MDGISDLGTCILDRLARDNSVTLDDHRRIESKLNQLIQIQENLSRSCSPLNSRAPEVGAQCRRDFQRVDVSVIRSSPLQGQGKCPTCQGRTGNQYQLETFLGKVFLRYLATPVLIRRIPGCQCRFQTDLTLVYSFPRWFMNYTLAIRMQYNVSLGLQCLLIIRPTLPRDHIVFDLLDVKDFEGIRNLFQSKHVVADSRTLKNEGLLSVCNLCSIPTRLTRLVACNTNGKYRRYTISLRTRCQSQFKRLWISV